MTFSSKLPIKYIYTITLAELIRTQTWDDVLVVLVVSQFGDDSLSLL